jgi:hypothetical protein
MSEGNGGGPEQLGGGSQPTGVSVEIPEASTQTPSFENPTGLATTPAISSETESASQTAQAQPEGETQALHPEQSSNKPINMIEILTQEFKLSEDQQKILKQKIPELKEKGIDLESFSEEDLGDPQKMGIILEIIGSEEMELNEEQRENLEKIKETLKKAEQGEQLTEEQIKGEIDERMKKLNQRIAELEGKENLTDEERKELDKAKNDLQAIQELKNITQSNVTAENEHKRVESKRDMLRQKIRTYGTYAAVGMGLLLLVFAWRGLKETGGGQGRGMMG